MQFCIGMGDLISDVNDKPQIHLVNFANFFFFSDELCLTVPIEMNLKGCAVTSNKVKVWMAMFHHLPW